MPDRREKHLDAAGFKSRSPAWKANALSIMPWPIGLLCLADGYLFLQDTQDLNLLDELSSDGGKAQKRND